MIRYQDTLEINGVETDVIIEGNIIPGEKCVMYDRNGDGNIDKDGEEFAGETGKTVGVWYSAGMRELMNLADCKVRMKRDETLDKDVGQPQPMKGYRIQFAKGSVRRALPEAPRFGAQSSDEGPSAQQELGTDDIPF